MNKPETYKEWPIDVAISIAMLAIFAIMIWGM